MIILAVDADHGALEQLEDSLKSVFTTVEVQTFDNALNSFRYYLSQKEEVAAIFFPLAIKPFDGFKYSELVMQSFSSVKIVFTTQTDSEEIRELIRLNGGNRHMVKPVTPDKIQMMAIQEQEICLDESVEDADGKCQRCIYHWCKNWKKNKSIFGEEIRI